MDLAKNIPSHDIELVAPTATLVARNSLHPAWFIILKASAKVHHQPGIFEKKSEFPFDKDFVFQLMLVPKNISNRALRFGCAIFRFGSRHSWSDLFPCPATAAIVIPLLKLIPRFLNWRIRSRIYQGYYELKLSRIRFTPILAAPSRGFQ